MNSAPPRAGLPGQWVAAYGNWLFKYRNKVFPAFMLALFFVFVPALAGGSPGADSALDQLGLLVATIGQLLRAAVIGLAYIKRGGMNKQVYAERLVGEGLFAHARNPLYVGNLLILAGLFIIHNNPWVYLLGGIFFVTAYMAIVAAEEMYLLQKFGDEYRDYCARVNRWLPDPSGLGKTLQGMTFNWRRVLLKDYASCYVWVMTALALQYYESLANFGFQHSAHRGQTVFAYAIAATVILGVLRYLKKSKRLIEAPL